MSVEEIEHAIRALSANEFALIAERVHAGSAWDAELDRDAGSGKLDFLIEEAKGDRADGRLMDWPVAALPDFPILLSSIR